MKYQKKEYLEGLKLMHLMNHHQQFLQLKNLQEKIQECLEYYLQVCIPMEHQKHQGTALAGV